MPATDRPPTTDRCVQAILNAADPPDEVIVVDSPAEMGPAAARNGGAARAKGSILIFVDSDVMVHHDAFTRIRAAFEADPDLAAVFGSYDDLPSIHGVVSTFRNMLHHYVHQASGGVATTFWAGLGAVRREAFVAVDGFDDWRFRSPSVEDIELGLRLASAGGLIKLDPEIQGTHLKRWGLGSMLLTDWKHRSSPPERGRTGRPSVSCTAVSGLGTAWRLMAAALAALALAALAPPALAGERSALRDVLVVSNNWAGSADLVDPHTFKRLKRLNVVPDRRRRIEEIKADPTAKFFFDNIRDLVGEGHNQYVDDGFTSPDGKVVYFSRPSFADVVAISLQDRQDPLAHKDRRLPRRPHGALAQRAAAARLRVDGERRRRDRHPHRADRRHGSRRATSRTRTTSRATGGASSTPASASSTPTPTTRLEDATKGKRVFEVIDARTLKVLKTIDMGQKLAEAGYAGMSSAVRPDGDHARTSASSTSRSRSSSGSSSTTSKRDRVVDVLDLPLGAAEGLAAHASSCSTRPTTGSP